MIKGHGDCWATMRNRGIRLDRRTVEPVRIEANDRSADPKAGCDWPASDSLLSVTRAASHYMTRGKDVAVAGMHSAKNGRIGGECLSVM
jgi:hypothetical protein